MTVFSFSFLAEAEGRRLKIILLFSLKTFQTQDRDIEKSSVKRAAQRVNMLALACNCKNHYVPKYHMTQRSCFFVASNIPKLIWLQLFQAKLILQLTGRLLS
jgi:hypothetical protein